MSEGTLSHLRVLDLSQRISGPYCTRLLAGWGAEVVKVEEPGKGDTIRNTGPFLNDLNHPETSAPFLYLNTGKKSITLNLDTANGTKILKDLIKQSDVLVENFAPGFMKKLGLDYAALEQINPKLVMTSITLFGQDGPYKGYKANSIVSYAMGGQMWVNGEADREPLNARIAIPEYFGGLYAFIGTMIALEAVTRNGSGQHVDISIMESLVASHQFTITWPAYSDSLLTRPGWPGLRAPTSLYACKDGYVNLRLQGIEMSFLACLFEIPELVDDIRFSTPDARKQNSKELEAIVSGKLAMMNKKDIFRLAGEWRQLCGYVATPEDLLSDPQYKARDFWVDIDHPYAGKQTYPNAPVKMLESSWNSERAPLLGEHNEDVFCDLLGYSKDNIERLRESGVI